MADAISYFSHSMQTDTNDVPLAVMAFQGKLVAGVGKSLRIYDMGKKKLLRKVENKVGIRPLSIIARCLRVRL